MNKFTSDIILIIFSIFITVAVVGLIVNEIYNKAEWEEFSTTHNCEEIERKESFSSKYRPSLKVSVMVKVTQTKYLCDDGNTYLRTE
jgi:hypothetical protein